MLQEIALPCCYMLIHCFCYCFFLGAIHEITLMFSKTWDRPYSVCWNYAEGRKLLVMLTMSFCKILHSVFIIKYYCVLFLVKMLYKYIFLNLVTNIYMKWELLLNKKLWADSTFIHNCMNVQPTFSCHILIDAEVSVSAVLACNTSPLFSCLKRNSLG